VVLHGLGSGRANHGDYAARLAAAGINALAIDLRGHGESGGTMDVGMVDDVLTALDWLAAEGAGALGVRGSSLGGFLALHAAVRHSGVRAVAAICPAHQDGLAQRRGLAWALEMPLEDAVAREDGVARGFWHATGDDLVPWQWSQQLFGLSPHPRRLRIAPGGDHGSLQHDPTVQADTIAFLSTHLSGE
jgi:pimeloyl-ACP methyl ester carboxylesterase